MRELLRHTLGHAEQYLAGLDRRPVGVPVDPAEIRARFDGPLPAGPTDPLTVVDDLVAAAGPGLVASAGPRYFGFVTGGSLPAALAADWLTSAWDQLAGAYAASPAAAAAEAVAGEWTAELFGLPAGVSCGFVTGATMANFTALAAARHAVLGRHGVDVDRVGLAGAPAVQVLAGAERHVSIDLALRYLGIGTDQLTLVEVDGQGAMRPDDLARHLRRLAGRPVIVCAQSGNVDTGAFDPLTAVCGHAREAGAWTHVDGAFGLWAAASPALAHHVAGLELADSWAVDAHKWLNVPYDNAMVFVRDPADHRAATGKSAPYLTDGGTAGGPGETGEGRVARENYHFVPEASRRARGFTVYAALRSLGASGIADLVDRNCAQARRLAGALAADPAADILNEVVLNQVMVRFRDPAGQDDEARTRAVVARVQADGTAWAGTTRWRGLTALRVSVSGWRTTDADIDLTVEAIRRAATAP
jgi:glutamate/tyrosine decarboxylase-like PLP-dependent enzyme